MSTQNTVVPFPVGADKNDKTSFEKIWGKKVQNHGYAAIPSIMIRSQRRLGINTTQFCILVQLLEYFRSPDRAPFPTKQQLADRIGIKATTIKANMQTLEKAGLIEREQHRTSAGDWGANTYLLDGLVAKIKALEPDFAKEREEKEQARKKAETPRGRRTRS
jgi:Winged helix-turn-helix DNA-binding